VLQPPSSAGTACAQAFGPDVLPEELREHILAATRQGPVSGYLYDLGVATATARELRAALPEWVRLLFALKSNGLPEVAGALAGPGGVDGFEVASAREARLARRLCPGGLVAAAGPAKHPGLLAELVDAKVDVIHAESVQELHRISRVAQKAGSRIRVGLRVNPASVEVSGTLTMGGCSSPFGIADPEIDGAVAVARSLPGLDLVGFHMHAVSGNRDARAHAAYVDWGLRWSVETARRTGVELRWVDLGGGLGVSYDGRDPLDLEVLASELDVLVPPAGVEVVLEPGRRLAAACGWYAAEVVDVKASYGESWAILRGGIGGFALPGTEDFPLPVAVLPVDDWRERDPRPEARDRRVHFCGELCTPEDVLARDVHVRRVRAGDVVVFPNAGAYGWEFALHSFLGHPAPTRTSLRSTVSPLVSPVPVEVTP
jgi:diaminopimelate decarboxylase